MSSARHAHDIFHVCRLYVVPFSCVFFQGLSLANTCHMITSQASQWSTPSPCFLLHNFTRLQDITNLRGFNFRNPINPNIYPIEALHTSTALLQCSARLTPCIQMPFPSLCSGLADNSYANILLIINCKARIKLKQLLTFRKFVVTILKAT